MDRRSRGARALQDIPKVVRLLLLGIALASAAVYATAIRDEQQTAGSREKAAVSRVAQRIAADFEPVAEDLLLLSRSPELGEFLARGDGISRDRWTRALLGWAGSRRDYFRIRLLDLTGRDVVRVSCRFGVPVVEPDDRLSLRSAPSSFTDAFVLDRGEIYVSPFELNDEQGTIERPPQPTVRFGTPVFDPAGNKRGLLLLNLEGEKLLQEVRQRDAGSGGEFYLLNADGYWLKGPSRDDEWGFMFASRRETSFAARYPAAWNQINASDSGCFVNRDGLYAFDTAHPVSQLLPLASVRLEPEGDAPKSVQPYQWKVVSFTPRRTLIAETRPVLVRILVADLLLVLLGAPLMRALSRARQRRRRAARLRAIQVEGARVLAVSASLAEATPGILRALGQMSGWALSAIWTVDPAGDTMTCIDFRLANAGLPSASTLDDGEAGTRSVTCARGQGVAGRAWEEGRPIWETGTEAMGEPQPFWTVLGTTPDAHTVFAFPLPGDGMVIGVVELWSQERRPLERDLMDAAVSMSASIGRFMARRQAAPETASGAESTETAEPAAAQDPPQLTLVPPPVRAIGETGIGRADAGKADVGNTDFGGADIGNEDVGSADIGKAGVGGADSGERRTGESSRRRPPLRSS